MAWAISFRSSSQASAKTIDQRLRFVVVCGQMNNCDSGSHLDFRTYLAVVEEAFFASSYGYNSSSLVNELETCEIRLLRARTLHQRKCLLGDRTRFALHGNRVVDHGFSFKDRGSGDAPGR